MHQFKMATNLINLAHLNKCRIASFLYAQIGYY